MAIKARTPPHPRRPEIDMHPFLLLHLLSSPPRMNPHISSSSSSARLAASSIHNFHTRQCHRQHRHQVAHLPLPVNWYGAIRWSLRSQTVVQAIGISRISSSCSFLMMRGRRGGRIATRGNGITKRKWRRDLRLLISCIRK